MNKTLYIILGAIMTAMSGVMTQLASGEHPVISPAIATVIGMVATAIATALHKKQEEVPAVVSK